MERSVILLAASFMVGQAARPQDSFAIDFELNVSEGAYGVCCLQQVTPEPLEYEIKYLGKKEQTDQMDQCKVTTFMESRRCKGLCKDQCKEDMVQIKAYHTALKTAAQQNLKLLSKQMEDDMSSKMATMKKEIAKAIKTQATASQAAVKTQAEEFLASVEKAKEDAILDFNSLVESIRKKMESIKAGSNLQEEVAKLPDQASRISDEIQQELDTCVEKRSAKVAELKNSFAKGVGEFPSKLKALDTKRVEDVNALQLDVEHKETEWKEQLAKQEVCLAISIHCQTRLANLSAAVGSATGPC
eukprot:TRINITY_DN21871_c0_g1_i1.p1 TRINITY_DN21871_c0_g1~~TRINITY_DN21871_c0_g1_i1.p1  ORF type:complete len:301 (+),score=69.17 TRINITY_DN21871_c0_g1_i1:62-964(+)